MAEGPQLRWSLDNIDFAGIDAERMRARDDLMCLLCASAFVESGSDLYTHNLVRHYAGDDEVQGWLRDHWEHEELQHGRALAAYVCRVWPDFDWQAAFESFFAEYSKVCTDAELEPSRTLEMAARCVVETGTATLYRAVHEHADEPVLKDLAHHIKDDEVHHYSYFYRYFRKYQGDPSEHAGRMQVLAAVVRRLREMGNEDADIALRYVFKFRHPEYLADKATFRRHSKRIYAFVRHNAAAGMTVKMLLKPLDLPPPVNARLQPPLVWALNRFVLH